MLPEWVDAERLQWITLAVIGLCGIGMFLVMRLVRQVVTKLLLFIVLAGFGLSLWLQRADLAECAETCSCTLFGEQVGIPEDQRPDRCKPSDG